PVALGEAGHHHVLAGARGMHEAAIAEVDADMVDTLAAAAEEHQVTGAERAAVHLLAAARHLPRDARQLDAQRAAEHVANQSTAVEAFGGAAAPAVWRAKQGQRALEQGLDAAVDVCRNLHLAGGPRVDQLVDVV